MQCVVDALRLSPTLRAVVCNVEMPPEVLLDRQLSRLSGVALDATMNYLRQFADVGAAVIVVSSVGRQKNSKGSSTYAADSLNLASFKESGELEFGADDAFILAPVGAGQVKLSPLKARHRRPEDILFLFDGSTQRFDPITEDGTTEAAGNWSEALRDLWSLSLLH